jgi:hypothetical protein
MNEKLMKVVERAVRPVRAGKDRKMQMREELLAHLAATYEEERKRQPDDLAAFAAAAERFGDPAELSRELAASVGWRERCSFEGERCAKAVDRTPGCQAGEPLQRYLVRSASWIIGLQAALMLTMIGVVALSGGRLDPMFASFNWLTLILFSSMAAGICAFLWAIQTTGRVVDLPNGRTWILVAGLQAAGWTLFFVLLAAGFWMGITHSLESVAEHFPRIAISAALTTPAILLVCTWLTHVALRRNRRYQQWAKLNLEET